MPTRICDGSDLSFPFHFVLIEISLLFLLLLLLLLLLFFSFFSHR
jgi:hypothetical protein